MVSGTGMVVNEKKVHQVRRRQRNIFTISAAGIQTNWPEMEPPSLLSTARETAPISFSQKRRSIQIIQAQYSL